MVEFIKVTAKTPYGDTNDYLFMGDLDDHDDETRFLKFLVDCCDDCADRFSAPDEWDPKEWRDQTCAMWEPMETTRTSFGNGIFDNAFFPPHF